MTIHPLNSSASCDSPDLQTALTKGNGGRVFSFVNRSRSGGLHSPGSVPSDQLGALSRSLSGGTANQRPIVRSDSLYRTWEVDDLKTLIGGHSPKRLDDEDDEKNHSLSRAHSDNTKKVRQVSIAPPPRAYQPLGIRVDLHENQPRLSIVTPVDARTRSDGDRSKKLRSLVTRTIIEGSRIRSSGDASTEKRILIQSPSEAEQLDQLHPLTRSSSGILRDALHSRLDACQRNLNNGRFSTDALRVELFLMKTQVDDFLKNSEEKFRISPQQGSPESQKSKLKTSDLVHELRAPLNGIGGYLDLLEMDLSPAEKAEAINGLAESYRHLGEVLKNDITDSEELDVTLNSEKFTVQQVFQRVGSNTKMTDSNVKVEFKFLGDEADRNTPLTGDFLKVCKILINLTNNGIKYSEKPGTVLIQVQVWKKDDGKMTLRFFVRDRGAGMPKAFMQNNLFKPFSKGEKALNSNQKASGLGLYLSQKFAEVMGSKIEVASNQPRIERDADGREVKTNVGTVFYFETEYKKIVEKPASQPAQEQKTNGPLQGRRLLVLEDEATQQTMYRRIFGKSGADVVTASSATEALSKFETQGPFHAILSDQNVEGTMKGLDVAVRIEAIARRAGVLSPPFVLCSGDDLEKRVDALRESLPRDFILSPKPMSFPFVIKRIKEYLDAR